MPYISIFQPITQNRLLFTLQRYEFFSKSQLNYSDIIGTIRCCLPYKATNFSANHNLPLEYYFVIDVIYYLAPPKFRKVKHSGISKVKQPTKYSIIQEM